LLNHRAEAVVAQRALLLDVRPDVAGIVDAQDFVEQGTKGELKIAGAGAEGLVGRVVEAQDRRVRTRWPHGWTRRIRKVVQPSLPGPDSTRYSDDR